MEIWFKQKITPRMDYEWNGKTIQKKFASSLHFLFRRDQNHYSNLTSKIMKMCEQILKNIAGRIPETTRRKKLPILMTKQLEQLL